MEASHDGCYNCLRASQSRIYPNMLAKCGHGPAIVSKRGEVQTHMLCNFYKYIRYNNANKVSYNTANNVSNGGGDPLTQLIVNFIKRSNYSLVTYTCIVLTSLSKTIVFKKWSSNDIFT